MSHRPEVSRLLRSGVMTFRRPAHGAPRPGARRPGAPVLRGIAIVVVAAGVGTGTWVLGSGPDASRGADTSQIQTVPGVVESPGALPAGDAVVTQPPLSVAPAPPAEAVALAKRDEIRATRHSRS